MLEAVNARVPGWIAVGLVLAALGAVAWWWTRGDGGEDREGARRSTRPARLDAEAFRVQQAARLVRAKQLAARPVAVAPAPSPPSGKWPMQGRGALPNAGKELIAPACILGPGELCETLAELIIACDAGDARACLAVGQFLADTPPRPLIASLFFFQACRIGDPAGCERTDELKASTAPATTTRSRAAGAPIARPTRRCSTRCARSAPRMRARSWPTPARIEQARGYLETACQLGSPMVCMELGHRLRPDCTIDEHRTCYPPDAAQATAALEIACSAGRDAACDQLANPP